MTDVMPYGEDSGEHLPHLADDEPLSADPLQQLAQLLNCIDSDELLDLSIEWIPRVACVNLTSIFLVDRKGEKLVMMRHNHRNDLDVAIDLDDPGTLILEVFRKQKAILIHDIAAYVEENDLPIELNKRQKYSSGSCMLVPIFYRPPGGAKEIIGALNMADKTDLQPFSKDELRFASKIGETLGTAIHNTRIIERKLGGHQKELLGELHSLRDAVSQDTFDAEDELAEAARRVEEMLPDLPSIPGFEIAVHYSPMEGVGGDFYDFFAIDEHRTAVVIGDVAGHGIEAALVMSMTKQVLSLYGRVHGNVREALIRANEEIHGALQGDSFISIFFGILDHRTYELRYGRAGHNPPMLFNANRDPKLTELTAKGMVVGTTGGKRFGDVLQEQSVLLQSGDVLLLYTDGLVEAMTAEGEEFGEERLRANIEANSVCSADLLVSRLSRHVAGFSAAQDDDRTMLVLKAGELRPTAAPIDRAQPGESDLLVVGGWLGEGELGSEAADEVFVQDAEPAPLVSANDDQLLAAHTEALGGLAGLDAMLTTLEQRLDSRLELTERRRQAAVNRTESLRADLAFERASAINNAEGVLAELLDDDIRALLRSGKGTAALTVMMRSVEAAAAEGPEALAAAGERMSRLARALPSVLD